MVIRHDKGYRSEALACQNPIVRSHRKILNFDQKDPDFGFQMSPNLGQEPGIPHNSGVRKQVFQERAISKGGAADHFLHFIISSSKITVIKGTAGEKVVITTKRTAQRQNPSEMPLSLLSQHAQ